MSPNEVSHSHWELFLVRRGFETVRPLFELVQERGYIAGSYAAFMAAPGETPIQPNDIDIFATSAENARAIARDWENKSGDTFVENELVYSVQRSSETLPIQIVKPNPNWQAFPEDLLNSFDLDICRAVLIAPNTVLADSNVGLPRGKVLRVNNPLRSLKRILKYHTRGIEFADLELLKLFQAWDQMKPEHKEDLVCQSQPTPDDNDGASPDYNFEWDPDDWFDGE